MYAVIAMFALALLSPLPFVSPFVSVYADELPFEKQQSSDIPILDSPVETSTFDGPVELIASQIATDTIVIKAKVNNVPSYAIVANSTEIPFNFPTDVFKLSTDNNGNPITEADSESWFAHEHIEYSYIENGTPNAPILINRPDAFPNYEEREYDQGLKFGSAMANLGDVDGDGISDIAIGSAGDGDEVTIYHFPNGTEAAWVFDRKNQGAFHILLMKGDGTIKSSIRFDADTPNMPSLENAILQPFDVEFGNAIASLGDVYNDGTIVLAIGANYHSSTHVSTDGAVYILNIGYNGTRILNSFVVQPDTMGYFLPEISRFGGAVANIGDVDNNGVPDIAVGAIGTRLETNASRFGGGVFIIHMGENAQSVLKVAASLTGALELENDPNTYDFVFKSDQVRFGGAITLLNTYDDGTITLAMSAPAAGTTTDDRIGFVYIVNMTDEASVVSSVTTLDHMTPNLGLNERNYDIDGKFGLTAARNVGSFGTSLVNMGDLNGNGVNDILVGYAYLNTIGGAYILYMHENHSIQHVAKFQIDRIETEAGTAEILNDDQRQIDAFRKYFNYSNPPNMPTSEFQEHLSPITGNIQTNFFDLGTAVVDFGDVYNDGYTDIGLSSVGHNQGTILVLNRLGPVVNVTFDPNYGNIETIHYRPTATDFITADGIELHNDLDIVVHDNIKPAIVNATFKSPDTFTITFHRDIDASSVSVSDFAINGTVYSGTVVSVSGAVVTMRINGIFAEDVVHTVSIADEVLDTLGNAAGLRDSASTTPMVNEFFTASRVDKNTITLDFDGLSINSDNTNTGAFIVSDATVVSWSITSSGISIVTSGLTGTDETPTVVYDSSHSTNLKSNNVDVQDGISATAADKIPPEYIGTVATHIDELTLQFSERLGSISLDSTNFVLSPTNIIEDIDIVDNNIILTVQDNIIQFPDVTYSALIADSLGNSESQSNTVSATDGFGPTLISARTIDINVINIVFHEEFNQTIFDGSSIRIDNLEVKDVTKINQTALQIVTEQFSSGYLPPSIRVIALLTDSLGNANPLYDLFEDQTNMKDGVAPSPIRLFVGYPTLPGNEPYYRTIYFDELLGDTLPASDSVTLYNTSSTSPHPHQLDKTDYYGTADIWVIESYAPGLPFGVPLYMNVTGPIPDLNNNNVRIGTILHDHDGEIPQLITASVKDSNTITMTFDKIINFSTVSAQDFTVNATIAVSNVLTRGDTIYLTTDTLLPRETYLVSLVGSIADFVAGVPDATSISVLYETVIAENFTITSNNANSKYAKSGDALTVSLTIDQVLTSVDATILESSVQPVVSSDNKTITIDTIVPINIADGFATFAINVETENGSLRTFTQNDLADNINVLIDNTNPSFVSGSYGITKLVDLTFSENISSASAYEHDNNIEILTTINGSIVTLDTTHIQNTNTTINATVSDYAGNSYSYLPTNISSLINPIKISSLDITNNGTSIVRANQTITVTLVTDGTDLGDFTGVLLGKNITGTNPPTVLVNTSTPGTAIFTTTVLSDDTNGNVTFSIAATNSSGNQLAVTDDDITDGSFVTVDTIKPVITLIGSPTDTILQGNNYTDQGATVSDLNYPSSIQTVTALPAPLITSTLGDQIITYSAPDDPAGNTPDSIIRTVTVLAKPLNITTLTITSNNNVNTSYAKANDVITLTLVANGTIGSSTTVSIASTTITPTITSTTVTNDTLTASYTVESSLADTTSLAFTITTYNEDNLQTVTSTVADLAGSSIIIDNTAPTITLQGDDPLVFYTSRSSSNTEFVDPGADAYDLSYETLRINATTTPDISVPGTFTLNYEAPDDLAGNTGPTVTRALTVQDAPSISITSLSILTATGNSAYAKAGEGIFLTLTVNDTIVSHNTQILGASPHSSTIDTNTLRINAITPNDGTESNATFTITVENAIGATLTVTENDLLGSNVFVDTLSPRIELVGAADYFVIKDTTNLIIPNVTITEHDPNYSNTFTLTTPDGIVDATVNGSVYNYTYTAAADTAGNLGDSVSRTITVIDADPITITSLSIASSPGNPNLANAGKIITVTLETDGTDLGNFTGTLLGRDIVKGDVTSGSTTFTTTVLDNDTNGDATFSIIVTNSSGNRIVITNTDITDSSYVTIDTTKPVITLYGISPDTVLQGNSYTDLGATATDLNNPSYEQLATASAFTTSSLGEKTITYSAPADDAGNTPDSITRTVNVLAKPLGIDALTITSNNNVNTSYAKAGDVITLRLDANGTLGSSTTVSIASNTVQHTLANDILTVSYTVESSLGDTTSLPFIISASNEDNLQTRTFTQANLPGSSIIIDNTAPSITLNGDNNTIVATNSSYTDSGATASDTSYAGDIQITGTGNVDIAQSGNYTVTYTAPADAAGNLAPSIIRIVSVVDLPPIDLTALTITSASSGKYVKAGDTLFLTLTLNDTLVSHNSQILGASITSDSISTNILYLQAVISNDVIESYAEFTVMVTNDDGVTLTVTEDDLSDLGQTNVFIDTVSPSLTLIDGPANYSIVNGTTPIIRNVTAHDGDPNYLETYTLTTNATVNADVNGSVYNYTYTAVADTAGNLGESISRIITIIDADPIGVTSLSITSNSGDNFANAGKTITLRLETDSTDLGNFTGTLLGREFSSTTSGGTATFTTIVLSNDTNGNVTFSIQATNSSNGRVAISESDIEDGSYVTIDTVKPVITLYGISPDTVLQGNSYTDLGATATDLNNPSYEQLATASALTTSSIGEKTITYSAPADDAGNTPDSITRTVNVLAKPLGIDALTITSNNANSSYAKANDVITLRLDANGTLGSSTTVSIASNTVQHTLANDILTVSYTVESSLGDTTSLPFIISASNEDNQQTRTFTQANLPGSSIIIDNTAPSITLNGPNNTIVATNNAYTDLGATASDSSYAGDIQVTGTSNVDITQSGNYTVTYTAPADAAGNLAPSIIRIVSVVDLPPIDLTALTITSASSGKYVKAGDTLFLTLTLNDTLVSHNSQILGASITSDSISTNILYLQAVISNDVIESYAEFNIAVTNDDGVTLTVTEDDLSDLGQTNVFIDTVSPRLTLIDGPANYSIINGTTNPIIRNVTAYDGDPNYLETYTLTTNAIVDASVNGSVYNYTYTAVADTAGNLGESISRIITIIDALPIDVTSLSITSSPGNPNFAKADDTITLVLRTDSNDLGNITGTLLGREFTNSTSGGSATFTTTVLSGDTNGNVTFSIEATNSSDGRVAISESDITDGSFVTIDTILPVITLNGINNTIVAVGADYTDPGAAITDPNNPSYAGTITANPATVDTSSSGNKTITYTAPADAAGNVPDSITRIVAVEDAPPIEITLFTITSNNNNNSYAKAGDTLTIQSSINYTIASFTATIFGIEQSVQTQNSNGFLISQQVPYDLAIEENATFSITIVDEKGLPNTITENTLITSSQLPPDNIFIDTISPTITKLLPESITFEANADLSNITTTVNDGAPNYVTSITIDPSTIVNTSIPGVYPFTYSAPDDAAGNPGQSATINFIVEDGDGSTVLNSSIIDDTPQSFSNSESIKAEIHDNNVNASNTLELSSPIVELDVSGITTSVGTTTHTTTYRHPLDLIVNNGISAQIESGTVLTFTADPSDKDNFIVKYLPDDGHNDDAIQLGLENVSYALTNDAIAITFERVSSSPTVYLRDNANDPYMNISLYSGIVTDGASAYTIIKATNSIYDSAGALYTHDTTMRTVTLWTTHLSTAKENSTSSSGGGDESDSNSPTLGKASSGAQLVTNGFEYNGLTVNVGRYHTEFPLIGTNVGDINTIKMKVYDSAGPTGVKRVEFALGVPDIGLYHEAEAFVEVWMQRDSVAVQETIIVDELNLLENSDVSATVSQTSCSGDAQQCLLVELQYSYREPPAYNTISIKPVDWDNNAHQFYFNDGIHVDGDSINLPKEITISASHAADTTHAGETLHLVQIDRAEHLWVDQYGYQWKIIGNTVRQITVPEYLVPDDNTYGTLHGPDRNHPEFASSVYAEQQKAQETLAEILGHATIMKPLPESGGTIYFDATGTDSRSGDSFKLLLELETARMQQLSNLLYDDTN